MADDLLVARNPDPDSSLPYLVRIPLGPAGIVVKARETWPKASKVYCHRADGWPEDAEIVERHPVRSCSRRGPAIDLVLDRARQNRSQLRQRLRACDYAVELDGAVVAAVERKSVTDLAGSCPAS